MGRDSDFEPDDDDAEGDKDFRAPVAVASTSRGSSAPTPGRGRGRGRGRKLVSSYSASNPPPKLKVKVASDYTESVFTQRKHDRELDSEDDEEMVFEEQFILRLPPGDMCKKVREMVTSRELGSKKNLGPDADVPWFKFRDSRRAIFGFGKANNVDKSQVHRAKLVDLPCIIESHKTLDAGKHMYKVADINQMLVVEEPVPQGDDPGFFDRDFNIEEFVWQHGITPPLRHVRKRRFRPRANKRTIELIERRVEELLIKDRKAEKVTYEMVDPSEEVELHRADSATPAPDEGGTPVNEDEASSQDGIDDDLAAELEKGIGEAEDSSESDDDKGDSDSDDDMVGLFGSGGSDPDDEDDQMGQNGAAGDLDADDPEKIEFRRRARLLADEVKDLEGVVSRKTADLEKQSNPLLKKRFEDTLKKLTGELELKRSQLAVALAGPKAKAPEDAQEEDLRPMPPVAAVTAAETRERQTDRDQDEDMSS